jgi:hypothetical protein
MGHTVPPSELRDRVATHEHGERCIGVVRQKEPYFSPPIWRIGHWEVKVWINSTPDQTNMSTLPKATAFVPEPYCSRALKK